MQPNSVEEMIGRLQDAGVEFVVVGGVSAILQGAAIVTTDLDVCYRRTQENLARLESALASLRSRPRLLETMSAIGGYEDVIQDAVEMAVGDCLVKVLSLEQLILTKRAAGRPKDLVVLPELQHILERKRGSGPTS